MLTLSHSIKLIEANSPNLQLTNQARFRWLTPETKWRKLTETHAKPIYKTPLLQ
jgi:hypothetical protein